MLEPAILWDLLCRAARLFPEKGLIFVEDGVDARPARVTYPELLREVTTNADNLRRARVTSPGQVVIMYFESQRDSIFWFWSIIAARALPAVLSPVSNHPNTAKGQLENLQHLFKGAKLITAPQSAKLFQAVSGLHVFTTQQIRVADSLDNKQVKEGVNEAESSDDLAMLLFTSGSSGRSKAVEFSHRQLLCSVKAKTAFHDINTQTNFMSWISFDHSANLCEIHLTAMYAGSDQVHIPTIELVEEPSRFYHVLSKYRVGYTFTPNFFLAAATKHFLACQEVVSLDFQWLSVIMFAGEANRTSTIEAADQILTRFGARPNTIKSAYGLSETCSACFYNTQAPTYDMEQGYIFASVGKHLPQGIEMRIVDDQAARQPAGGIGAIQLRGEIVSRRYHNNEAATSACITGDGWFDTGDLGVEDERGHLRIIGRSKEIIIINGNNYSSFELEHAIETSVTYGITMSYVAAFSIWTSRGESESVIVLFNPAETAPDVFTLQETIRNINKVVLRFCSKPAHEIIPLPKEMMPKSTIGKLSRATLKKQYEVGDFDKCRVPVDAMAISYWVAMKSPTMNGTTTDRSMPIGTITNVATTNGISTCGTTMIEDITNETTMNGLTTNGTPTKEITTSATTTDEPATNGITVREASPIGTTLNGTATNQIPMNGMTSNKTAMNGTTVVETSTKESTINDITKDSNTTNVKTTNETATNGISKKRDLTRGTTMDGSAVDGTNSIGMNKNETTLNVNATNEAVTSRSTWDSNPANVTLPNMIAIDVATPHAMTTNETVTNGVPANRSVANGTDTDGFTADGSMTNGNTTSSAGLTSSLQVAITRILAKELHLLEESISPDAELSPTGIDSLSYLRIKRRLEVDLRLEDPIPMPVLLDCRSVRELEHGLLRIGTTEVEYDPIVPLSDRGSKTPLFLCPPGGGEFLIWLSLLKYLPDRPVYALRAKGLQKNQDTFEDLDELLSCFLTAIRRRQPHGPYAFLGLCFGGVLAFELGKALEAVGEVVSFMGAIDTPADMRTLLLKASSKRRFFLGLLHFHSICTEPETKIIEKELEHISDKDFWFEVNKRFPDGELESLGLSHSKDVSSFTDAWFRVYDSSAMMLKEYCPTGIVSKFDVFWVPPMAELAMSDTEWYDMFLGGWKKHCKTEVNFHQVRGQHYSIVSEPYVQDFQLALNEVLRARDV